MIVIRDKTTIVRNITMTMVPNEIYVTTCNSAKWLILSSFVFTIPAIYAYIHSLYCYSGLLLLTSIVSANYWRRPTYSWRRNLDLVFSKMSFVIFAYHGIIHVRYVPYMITGYPLVCILAYCYYLSNKNILENKSWVIYHSMFHCIVMCEQLIVLDSIIPKKCN